MDQWVPIEKSTVRAYGVPFLFPIHLVPRDLKQMFIPVNKMFQELGDPGDSYSDLTSRSFPRRAILMHQHIHESLLLQRILTH